MKLYKVDDGKPDGPVYAGTRAEAQQAAKRFDAFDTEVALIDVPTDKENILAMLRGEVPKHTVIQRWELTARGGLKPVVDT
jgi:hypothetical protein